MKTYVGVQSVLCGVVRAALLILTLAVGASESCAENGAHPLVGAIRWDAWYGALSETASLPDPTRYPGYDATRTRVPSPDPGKEAQRSLAGAPWRYRWPFFTELNADGSAKAFNENRPEVLEKEIDYAVHAGLDYWAFDAYPEDCPLSYTLKTFLTCKNRDKIKFCLFLVMGSAYGRFADDEAFRTYAARMIAESNYLKVEGNRPVIYMGFLNDAIVAKLLDGRWQRFCADLARRGLGKPYLVVCHGNPASAKNDCDRLGGDALSDYNYSRGLTKEGLPFIELAAAAESFWERCEATGVSAVPICMAGFDWRPRAMSPVSWHACDERYSRRGTPDELAAHIGRGVAWYRRHPGKNGTELVLIYAWNELDEGGWLMPALPPPQGEGTARIDALRKVLGR